MLDLNLLYNYLANQYVTKAQKYIINQEVEKIMLNARKIKRYYFSVFVIVIS